MSLEKFTKWAIENKGKPMVCGNCFYFGKVTRYCHCKTNSGVKKRLRHESSPKCTEFKWDTNSHNPKW